MRRDDDKRSFQKSLFFFFFNSLSQRLISRNKTKTIQLKKSRFFSPDRFRVRVIFARLKSNIYHIATSMEYRLKKWNEFRGTIIGHCRMTDNLSCTASNGSSKRITGMCAGSTRVNSVCANFVSVELRKRFYRISALSSTAKPLWDFHSYDNVAKSISRLNLTNSPC